MHNTHYIKTQTHLLTAATRLDACYWANDEGHVNEVRQNICQALSGWDEDGLIDMIEEVVSDTHDIDVKDIDYARNIVKALLEYAVPGVGEKV